MPQFESNTHGQVLAGAAGTAAGDTDLGDITLPAGGPWLIHGIWAQVAPCTPTAAEMVGGYIQMRSKSGDITPDPNPCKMPVPKVGSALGATIDNALCPLVVYPLDFAAAGKSTIDLIYHNDIACTVAAQVVGGILYGKTRPEKVPFRYADVVRTTLTVATDTAVGTITLSEKASRIVGITAEINQDGVLTTVEELIGFCRLSSDDLNLAPAQYPCVAAHGGGLGALIMAASPAPIDPVPLDIPVPGGARIDCFIDLNSTVTTAAQASVTIFYV